MITSSKPIAGRLRKAVCTGLATALTATVAFFISGCTDQENGLIRYTDVFDFIYHNSGNQNRDARITAEASSSDISDYQNNTSSGVGFLTITQPGAYVRGGENYYGGHTRPKILDLPVGSVYSASDAHVFLPGKGAPLSYSYSGTHGKDVLNVTAGNQIRVPAVGAMVGYHTAWTFPMNGVYVDNYTTKSWRTDSNGHNPATPGQGGGGYKVKVHDYDLPGWGFFYAENDTDGFYDFRTSYPLYITEENAETYLTFPAGKSLLVADTSLTLPQSLFEAEYFARADTVTGRPLFYMFVPEDGVVTHRDPNLAFNDGELSLPAGSLIVLPNSEVIFRPGNAERDITVTIDGTVELWPGSSYEIDQGATVVVDTPGYYHISKRMFVPYAGNATVTFDMNGGDGVTPEPMEFLVGFMYGKYNTLPDAEDADEYFLGWYNAAGEHVTDMTPVPAGDHTLTARWISLANVYYVSGGVNNYYGGSVVTRGDGLWSFNGSSYETGLAMAGIENDRAPEIVIVFDDFRTLASELVFEAPDTVTHLRGNVSVENNSSSYVDGYALIVGNNAKVYIDAGFSGGTSSLLVRDTAVVTQEGGVINATLSLIWLANQSIAGVIVQDEAHFILNGGFLAPGGVVTPIGVLARDSARVTINGGAVFMPNGIAGFAAMNDAFIQVNGGELGATREALYYMLGNFGVSVNDNDPEVNQLIDVLALQASKLPISYFCALEGTPTIEVNGGTFRGGFLTYITSEMFTFDFDEEMPEEDIDLPIHLLIALNMYGALGNAMGNFGIVTSGDLNEPFMLLLELLGDSAPVIRFNNAAFDNIMANLVVTDVNGNVMIGNNTWTSRHKNIQLQEGAYVSVTPDFQGGEPVMVGIYSRDTLTNLYTQVSSLIFGGNILDGSWPAEEVQAGLDAFLEMAQTNGQIVVKDGAKWQEFFLPDGIKDKFFKIVGNDLVYELVDITARYHGNDGLFLSTDPATDLLEVSIELDGYENRLYYASSVEEPERDAYTFVGWNSRANGTGMWVEDFTFYSPGKSSRDLYAQWVLTPAPGVVTVDVTFFANGGEFSDSSFAQTIAYEFGDLFSDDWPEEPTRDGFTFVAWASRNGTVVLDDYSEVRATMPRMYYAQWEGDEEPYDTVINFYSEYNSLTGEGILFDTVPQAFDMPVALPNAHPDKIQHEFEGWYTLDGLRLTAATQFANPPPLAVAQWSFIAVGFEVVYDANGGTFDDGAFTKSMDLVPDSTTGLCYYEYPVEGVAFAGYTFTGWNTERDGSGEHIPINTYFVDGVSATTLYAQWELMSVPPVDVVFYANEGDFPGGAPSVTVSYAFGELYNAKLPVGPTRAGYTFESWVSENGNVNLSGMIYLAVDENTPRAFYPLWKVIPSNDYVIDFYDEYDVASGTGILYETVPQDNLPNITIPTVAPEKEGYVFIGWRTLDGVLVTAGKYLDGVPPLLVADWKSTEFVVDLDGTHGGYVTPGNTYTQLIRPQFGQPMPTPITLPVVDNCMFLGYHYLDDPHAPTEGAMYYFSDGRSARNWDRTESGLTLYALWMSVSSDTVIFHANGGVMENSAYGVTLHFDKYPLEPDSIDSLNIVYSMPQDNGFTPLYDGHVFVGWNTQLDGNGSWIESGDSFISGISAQNLYAIWAAEAYYTISYDANGGTDAPTAESVLQGSSATVGAAPTAPTGFTFAHWAVETAPATTYAAGASITPTADTTLVAVWNYTGSGGDTFAVTYNGNGATAGVPANQSVPQNSKAIVGAAPTRADNTFGGWELVGAGTVYQPGAWITVDSNITLRATWTYTGLGTTVTYYENLDMDFSTANVFSTGLLVPGVSSYAHPATTCLSNGTLEFYGWFSADGVIVPDGASFVGAPTELFAIWTPVGVYPPEGFVEVLFHGNGGTPAIQVTLVKIGNAYALPFETPSNIGFSFADWTAPDGASSSTFATVTTTSPRDFFAKWSTGPAWPPKTGDEVLVTFHHNLDNSFAVAAPADVEAFEIGDALAFPTVANGGKVLLGWFTMDGTEVFAGELVALDTPVALFAMWDMTPPLRELPIVITAIERVNVLDVESVAITVKALPEAVGSTELFKISFIGTGDLTLGFAPLNLLNSSGTYSVNQVRTGVTLTFEVNPTDSAFFYRAVSEQID